MELIIISNIILDGKKSSTIICITGKKFNINNKQYLVSDFNECANAITGSVINQNRLCGSDGVLMNIGFNDERGFAKLIDVCYSKKRGSSIYTSHTIHGKTIKNAMKASSRPSTFKTTELPSNISAASSFTKAKQLERFTQLFGNDKAEEYLNITYLARGHLSPDADMIFFSWQWATYYYINVIPQFQSINNGNWKHIESAVRTKAAENKRDLLVYTGGHDVLKLNNKKIALENDGLEVPKWSWKIIKDIESNSGIAFVTLNNPFANSITNLCNDVCNEFGWDWKERKNYSKGYTICCKINDLLSVIDAIPNSLRTNNVMEK